MFIILTFSLKGMRNEFQKVIDFIFTNGSPFAEAPESVGGNYLFVKKYAVLPQQWDDKGLASDHAPVYVELVEVERKGETVKEV